MNVWTENETISLNDVIGVQIEHPVPISPIQLKLTDRKNLAGNRRLRAKLHLGLKKLTFCGFF